MAVRLVEEIEEQPSERQRLLLHSVQELQPAREEPAAPKPRPHHRENLMELMATIASILGFRFQLFAGFLGAAGIGAYAVYQASPAALIAAGMFYLMVFAPLCWLAHKRG